MLLPMETTITSESDLGVAGSSLHFFNLPAELRHKILGLALRVDHTIDNNYRNTRRVAIFRVSKQFHEEAAAAFYGVNTFRLFPTAGSVSQPLIKRFSAHNRANMVSLELRLGPYWGRPPRSWKVTDALGLKDATGVRVLKVFIEIDPSHSIFNGFRSSEDFYTEFSGKLLMAVIKRMPNLKEIQFDGYPSVSRDGPLMKRLVEEATMAKKMISWGPGQRFDTGEVEQALSRWQAFSMSPQVWEDFLPGTALRDRDFEYGGGVLCHLRHRG